MRRYAPSLSVTTARTRSISTSLDASTVTPGSTAPEVSRTTPVIALCAAASDGASSTKETTKRRPRVLDMPPPSLYLPLVCTDSSPRVLSQGLLASILICFRAATSAGSSDLPLGHELARSTKAITSAFCWRVSFPGLSSGIVSRIRSNRSPAVRSFQFDVKAPPRSAGVMSPPSSAVPWQLAHSCKYAASPRTACASVYTPLQTEPGDDWAAIAAHHASATTPTARTARAPIGVAFPCPDLPRAAGVGRLALGEAEGQVLARVVAAADRDDDVLAAADAIGHRRAADRRRHPHRSHFLAALLVVGAQHRAARMVGRGRDLWIRGDDQRLGNQHADAAALPGLRDRETLELRVVADVVGRVAVRHLPLQVALGQVDRSQDTIGRLDHRQPFHSVVDGGRRSARSATSGGGNGRGWRGPPGRVGVGARAGRFTQPERLAHDARLIRNVREARGRRRHRFRREGRHAGLCVHDPGFGIGAGARPIGAPAGVAEVERAK